MNTSATSSYYVKVVWEGWDLEQDTDCGDGNNNDCEILMQVKYSTGSCSSLDTWQGDAESVSPGTKNSNTIYSFTYSKVGSWPCLTFKVRFYEQDGSTNTAATSEETYTATSSHQNDNLDLTIGSANGHFKIEYWKYDLPIFGP